MKNKKNKKNKANRKKKDNIYNIEAGRILSEFKTMHANGILNYKKLENGDLAVQLNFQVLLDFLDTIGDIPLSVPYYANLKRISQHDNEINFEQSLSIILAMSVIEFNKNGRRIDLIGGQTTADEEEISMYAESIYEYYDLHNPIKDSNKPYYWFKIRQDILEYFKEMRDSQKPEDFASYYLK